MTRSALQNAASIAALFLTTEAVIVDKPEKEGAMPAACPAAAWTTSEPLAASSVTRRAATDRSCTAEVRRSSVCRRGQPRSPVADTVAPPSRIASGARRPAGTWRARATATTHHRVVDYSRRSRRPRRQAASCVDQQRTRRAGHRRSSTRGRLPQALGCADVRARRAQPSGIVEATPGSTASARAAASAHRPHARRRRAGQQRRPVRPATGDESAAGRMAAVSGRQLAPSATLVAAESVWYRVRTPRRVPHPQHSVRVGAATPGPHRAGAR